MAIESKQKLMLFPRMGKFIILFFAVALVVAGFTGYKYFLYVFEENAEKDYILYITEKTSFEEVTDTLKTNAVLNDFRAFRWVARRKNYPASVKPGRYAIKKGMNANQIVNILRSGLQEPVKLTFNNVRVKEDLAGKVHKYLQADSLSILGLFENKELIQKYGFTAETFSLMFIPNTYEFYWTTTAEQFSERMYAEYKHFWDSVRVKKAENLEMTPIQVAILASIVQEEAAKNEEKPKIAGVFINRLKRGMPLQADPTVKFAVGDVTLRRILNAHLVIDSPYNTYIYAGLPPGPITFPEVTSIDAVLNFEKHRYLYFCAKPDFSGYHNFAATTGEHGRNAAAYQNALNQNRIYK